MVDWSLATQIARFAAGGALVPDLGVDLDALATNAEQQVARYTGLTLPGPAPLTELVERAPWAEIIIETLSGFIDPVGGRLSDRLERGGALAGALRAAGGAGLAAAGGLVGGGI